MITLLFTICGDNIDVFYKILSDILTKCILFFYERKLIKSILSYNYFYFDDLELKQILDSCIDLFNSDVIIYNEKYESIFMSVYEYISEHHSVILKGFVNFRLKNYKEILDYNVDLCVSNFLIEREYLEFINILQMYVNSKESSVDTIHVVYVNKESILIDEDKNIIPTKDFLFDSKYLSDISFSSNDYSLNALLSLLPKKLNIHLVDNYEDEFINTLKLIFENRVSICNDCDICRVYRFTNKIAKE